MDESQFNHFSVDIETLSTQPNATILSIGCCPVYPRSEIEEDDQNFYVEISTKQNRHIDLDTVAWWFSQPIKPNLGASISLSEALWMLTRYFLVNNIDNPIIWCRGPQFDMVILEDAYFQLGLGKAPWKYSAARDLRTLAKLFPYELPRYEDEPEHHALGDAKYQARVIRHLINTHNLFIA